MKINSKDISMAVLCMVFSSVQAQTVSPSGTSPATSSSDWKYNLGAAVISTPYFIGSDNQRILAVPTFQIRYKDWFFIDPFRGIGYQSKLSDGLIASAAISFDPTERRAQDDVRLNGLGNINMAPAVRLGLNYRSGKTFVNANVVSRLAANNARGTVFEADIGYNVIASRSAIVGVGLNLKGMDSTYARNFFGVSTSQSTASGLAAFDAKGGLQSSGLFVQAIVPVSDRWTFFGRAAYNQLGGDAGASPIIINRNQMILLSTLNYAF